MAQILVQALQRAADRGQEEAGSADLLAALLDEDESLAVRFLELFGFTADRIRSALTEVEAPTAPVPDRDDLPQPRLSPAAVEALEVGTAEAAAHDAP